MRISSVLAALTGLAVGLATAYPSPAQRGASGIARRETPDHVSLADSYATTDIHNRRALNRLTDLGRPVKRATGKPATTGGKPVGGKPVGGKPVDGKPVGGKPVGAKPVGGKPVGGKPVGGKPVDGKPVGGKPVGGSGGDGGQGGESGSESEGEADRLVIYKRIYRLNQTPQFAARGANQNAGLNAVVNQLGARHVAVVVGNAAQGYKQYDLLWNDSEEVCLTAHDNGDGCAVSVGQEAFTGDVDRLERIGYVRYTGSRPITKISSIKARADKVFANHPAVYNHRTWNCNTFANELITNLMG